jgi:hypothetical protein
LLSLQKVNRFHITLLSIPKYFLVFVLSAVAVAIRSQPSPGPVAKFSFNNKKDFDEVSLKKVKFTGIVYTPDRFGNENSSIYLVGNQYSYINLGNYPALKSKTASISLWINLENEIWAGQGYTLNPIIVTKNLNQDDFYEAYAMYYMLEGDNIGICTTKDSLNQIGILCPGKFDRYKWHHLVMAYNDKELCFYLDGKKQGPVTKSFITEFSSSDSVMIGVTANKKNSRYLNATIDDIEFYDRMLTEAEVKELHNAPNPNKNKIILNWILAGLALVVIALMLYILIKYQVRKGIKKERQVLELHNKLLKTELRVNRASMNPHFIFNSLNALHNFILAHEINNASNYLVKFSKIIRKILDSNMYDFILLELEIEILERYLEIENLRFEENIKYTIQTHEPLVSSAVHIPIMMLQPFIENAIWHGLLNKTGEKIIRIDFSLHEARYVCCVIEDNGIGRKKNGSGIPKERSLATRFIMQRLDLLNKIHNLKCSLVIEDKPGGQGTIVKILLPILNTH